MGNIWTRFNNLSDLNLFFYNEVKLADRKTLGALRKYMTLRRLRRDSCGQFRLFSLDLETGVWKSFWCLGTFNLCLEICVNLDIS